MDGLTPPRASPWSAAAAIAALFAAAWVAVDAWSDTPLIDDWVYGWSVEHLVRTGRLAVLPIGAIYPLFQIAWAAPFASLLGFSFVALRLSTVVLAVVGCSAIWMTLRELDVSPRASLLGALALALHPVFFALSFSFMTEVPFVSLSALALAVYVRAMRRHAPRGFWLAGAIAVAAYLVRPLGILLPIAAAAAVVADRRGLRRWTVLPALLMPLVVMGGLQVALPALFGPLDWAGTRTGYLQWWFMVPPWRYAAWTLEVLVQAVFPLAPLVVSALRGRDHATAAVVAALMAALCLVALGEIPSPLPDTQTWSLQELTARSMVGGHVPPSAWSLAARPWLQAAGLYVLAGAVVLAVTRWRAPSPGRAGLGVVAAYGLLNVAAIHLLWLYNDRYYVVLAPPLAVLAAIALDARPAPLRLAAIGLAAWAAVDVTGTRDMLAVYRAAAAAVADLQSSGVPAWEIDAGYTLNGWRLYAHPEALPPGADRRRDVPFVTSTATTAYSLANVLPEGTTLLREVPLDRVTWQATRWLYVVRWPAATPR